MSFSGTCVAFVFRSNKIRAWARGRGSSGPPHRVALSRVETNCQTGQQTRASYSAFTSAAHRPSLLNAPWLPESRFDSLSSPSVAFRFSNGRSRDPESHGRRRGLSRYECRAAMSPVVWVGAPPVPQPVGRSGGGDRRRWSRGGGCAARPRPRNGRPGPPHRGRDPGACASVPLRQMA